MGRTKKSRSRRQTRQPAKSWFKRNLAPLVILVAGLLVIIGGYGLSQPKATSRSSTPSAPPAVAQTKSVLPHQPTAPGQAQEYVRAAMSHLHQLEMWYMAVHKQNGPDKFWLTGHESMAETSNISRQLQSRLQRLMADYREVSPLAETIYQQFHTFFLTRFWDGASTRMFSDEDLSPEAMSNMLEVCVADQAQWQQWARQFFPSTLYFSPEWSAIMMAALVQPDGMQAALFYHELGHALRARVEHAPSASAPSGSELWVQEEVEMHELEYQVMDHASHGRFTALLDKILTRVPPYSGPDVVFGFSQIFARLKQQDYQEYDEIMELTTAGPLASSVNVTQFAMSLLIRFINTTVPPEQRLERKVFAYHGYTNQ